MTGKRTDRNHQEIVKALRDIGCSVQSLASIGKGCPDLLVGHYGRNLLFEVKDGSLPPSGRRLTADESDWRRKWFGQYRVVESAKEAVTVILMAHYR